MQILIEELEEIEIRKGNQDYYKGREGYQKLEQLIKKLWKEEQMNVEIHYERTHYMQ